MDNDLSTVLRQYFHIEGENFRFKGIGVIEYDVINNINDFIDNKLFYFSLRYIDSDSNTFLPNLFIVEWNDKEYFLIKRNNEMLVNLTSSQIVKPEQLKDRKKFYFEKQLKVKGAEDCLNSIISMTPKVSFFSVPLVCFALLIPLYANIFNTRLVYSDNFSSVIVITFFFLILVSMEFLLRRIIYKSAMKKMRENMSKCNDFFLRMVRSSRSKNISVNIKTIESALLIIWENRNQLFVDATFCILFFCCLFALMGVYVIPLLIFYLAVFCVGVVIRYSSYKKNIAVNQYSYERLSTFICLENNKEQLRFFRFRFIEDLIKKKTEKDEYLKFKLNSENQYWSEFVRLCSPLSMFVLFCSSYFAIANTAILSSSLIALMIINSRLSTSISGLIQKVYFFALNLFQMRNAILSLFKDTDPKYFSRGIYFDELGHITINNLSIQHGGKLLVDNLNIKVKKGDVIGILGRSGSGKTSLIKCLSGVSESFSGDIIFNDSNIRNVSEFFFQNNVSSHSVDSDFYVGTLKENFIMHGIDNDGTILNAIKKTCPNLNVTYDMLNSIDASDLTISNGEKQKILISLSLIKNPKLIFFDESTSFLSSDDALNFLSEIKNSHKDSIIFFATHDQSLTSLCTKIIHLDNKVIKNKIHVPLLKM
ncbi:TPA: ATP-binding cassette domain-containing protein [Escherichia coli]|nr:ATP-binding cassette domain-containing protein [Escherichia marmotae]HAY0228575.1 ATP-binding cassette domain-containing protein [Escherichia coli]MED9634510.1 ATP-binding cassette domain-containing protein [Escherichia marmotae]HEL8020308.1 ATP-binding cassette domain-containing protein [Escherichia coli]HEL8086650.1 ATP-binding cassette domain-containing protein [Escherichia coli]